MTEAGVAVVDARGNLRPLASSSERMQGIELIEIQRSDGPCLDCVRQGGAVREDDLGAAIGRWPQFGPEAFAAGFSSVYALPLRLRAERIGALNLFADRPAALPEDEEELAQAFADVATIGILHERLLRESETVTEQLQTALNSRVTLEQAKGVVAEQANVSIDEAFGLLQGYARRHNLRLGGVVVAIIDGELSASALREST